MAAQAEAQAEAMAAEVESGGAQVREELSASQAAMAEELAAAQEQLMELKIEVAEVSGLREEVSKLPELQASLGEALTEIDAHGTALEDRIERTESSLTRALAKLREEWEGQSSEAAAAVEAAGTQLSALETRTTATESALEGVTARCDSQESAAEGVAARCDALDAQCSEALAAAQDGSAQEELSARVESLGEEVAAAASGAAGAISAAQEASSAAAGQQEHERLSGPRDGRPRNPGLQS